MKKEYTVDDLEGMVLQTYWTTKPLILQKRNRTNGTYGFYTKVSNKNAYTQYHSANILLSIKNSAFTVIGEGIPKENSYPIY